MKRLATIILVLTIVFGCQPKNRDFNPFDDEYKFHDKFKLSDHDTVMGECGYWNLTNRKDGTYYQFYLSEKEIVAKGFNITLDDFNVDFGEDGPNPHEFVEALKSHPLDTTRIKSLVEIFDLKKVTFLYDTTSLTGLAMVDQNDSVHLAEVVPFWNARSIVRQVQYFKGLN